MSDESEDDRLSEISLDEEDEELIWRVFYSPNEKKRLQDNNIDAEEDASSGTEISDISEVEDDYLIAKYHSLKKSSPYNLNDEQKKRLLISSFTEDQMEKFESYRRMRVNKPGIKKICSNALGHSVSPHISTVLAGLSKLFLSEIITKAFEVQERSNKAQLRMDIENKKIEKKNLIKNIDKAENSNIPLKKLQYKGDSQLPLQPEHIREAWRLYNLENSGALSSRWRGQGEAPGDMFR